MTQQPLYYAGVDGGATKCRTELYDAAGHLLGAGVSGSANIARSGSIARQSIVESVQRAIAEAELPAEALATTAVFAGLAGANVPSAAGALRNWQHPFQQFHFTSDLHTALYGAHAGANGAVLVVGTGSCAAALVDGELIQYGGHGFLLGDKGSGAWLGKQAVTHTLEAMDGLQAFGALGKAVCQHYQCHSAIALVDKLNHASPGVFGELCPVILQLANRNDPVASALVDEASRYLSTIAQRAIDKSGGALVITGGVAGALTPWLDSAIQEAVRSHQFGPEWGAISLLRAPQETN